jgi:hypothetical protein
VRAWLVDLSLRFQRPHFHPPVCLYSREKLKVSKVAVSAAGDTSEKILLGAPGQAFTFASDAPNVQFAGCSAKTGKLDTITEFIHSC